MKGKKTETNRDNTPSMDQDENKMRNQWKYIIRNIGMTCLVLLVTTLMAFGMHMLVPRNTGSIALLYILGLVLISCITDNYIYGIASSIFSVICVNYMFTYPYFDLNFSLSGYPVIFVEMTTVSILVSTIMSLTRKQSKVLAEKEKQLQEAEREKLRANLLRAVSHDIRTPLTSIIGTINNLMDNDEELSSHERYTMEQHIKDDAIWMMNMGDNLLAVTRIHSSGTKLKMSLEPIEEVVSEAVSRLKKRKPEADIKVHVPDEMIMIPMDPILIEQVIMNLLENAVVHANSERPIELNVALQEEYVEFAITDYGIGLSDEQVADMFNAVPQDKSQVADSQKGMGMGLSICKTIIIAHGGTIEAVNHGRGATFYFKLRRNLE